MTSTGTTIARGPIDWPMVIGLVVIHFIALAGIWCVTWSGLVVAAVLYWVSGPLGICIGFHRLLTHGSFKTYRWVKYTLTFFGLLAWQGSPLTWVGTHRIHHKYPDKLDDPHSPLHGFTWAHMFWIFRKPPNNLREVVVSDLRRDRGLLWLSRYYPIPQLLLALVLAGVGYWLGGIALASSWVVWGIGVRTVVVYHVTWLINSACHTWGYKYPDSSDNSRNLWWLALLAMGENWHANHHRQQTAAAHGWHWWQLDINYCIIKLMSWSGLVWRIVPPKPHLL